MIAKALAGLMIIAVLAAGCSSAVTEKTKKDTEVLTVFSTPVGADTYVDGEYWGTTPVTREVPGGTHTVELRYPGFQDERVTITVNPGYRTRVSLPLSPSGTSVSVQPATTATTFPAQVTTTVPVTTAAVATLSAGAAYATVVQATSGIWLTGPVYGINEGGQDNTVNMIRFPIGLANSSPTIGFNDVVIQFWTENSAPSTYSWNPSGMPTTSAFAAVRAGPQGTAVQAISPGEEVLISFKTTGIGSKTKVTVEVRPPAGAPLVISRKTPSVLLTSNILT
ncbi:MAG: PEGA domain protein [Methanoregula sp. PtaU1.Bin051]|nr:MAG: PEGA domain protein [Methanoregula sp. PtaU1.Bin051]